jgi:protein gp37
MEKYPDMLWCDTVTAPQMGSIFPTLARMRQSVRTACVDFLGNDAALVPLIKRHMVEEYTPSLSFKRDTVGAALAGAILPDDPTRRSALAAAISGAIRHAYSQHTKEARDAASANDPGRRFEPDKTHLFPYRLATAALRSDLTGQLRAKERLDRPWFNGVPRIIFIPDVGGLLTSGDYEWVAEQLILFVATPLARRHIWVWRSNRPERVAAFGAWLAKQGIAWPANLIPFTNASDFDHINRVTFLREIPSSFRILSLEPYEELPVRLTGIDLVIAGGPTERSGHELTKEDMPRLRAEAHEAGAALFISHLNGLPRSSESPLMYDPLYPQWYEWPEEFRVRQLPAAWRHLNSPAPSVQLEAELAVCP